jgi:hypothetical protein
MPVTSYARRIVHQVLPLLWDEGRDDPLQREHRKEHEGDESGSSAAGAAISTTAALTRSACAGTAAAGAAFPDTAGGSAAEGHIAVMGAMIMFELSRRHPRAAREALVLPLVAAIVPPPPRRDDPTPPPVGCGPPKIARSPGGGRAAERRLSKKTRSAVTCVVDNGSANYTTSFFTFNRTKYSSVGWDEWQRF